MQKQAVLVCIVCALAALLTIGITLVLIHRGKEPAASSEQPGTEQPADDANIADHYQINEQSSALLPETADAGDAYQSETLFIGDSNTQQISLLPGRNRITYVFTETSFTQKPADIVRFLFSTNLIDAANHIKRLHFGIAYQMSLAFDPDRPFFQIHPAILHIVSTALCT